MLKDKDIREGLFLFLEERYGKIRILEEKVIGRSRADIYMVTDEYLYGIEIKSDADTYTRLSRQTRDYDAFYDRNILVVGTSHAVHAHEHVPAYWGIITVEEVDGSLDFYVQREAAANPLQDLSRQLTLLWRPELVHIQQKFNLPAYKEKSKAFVQQKLIEKVPSTELSACIRQELFERDYTTIKEEINAYRRAKGRRARRRPPKRR